MTTIVTFALLLLVAIYNVEGACQDQISNCSTYAPGFCNIYKPWAKKNCAKFCKMCTAVTGYCSAGWLKSSSDETCFKVFNTKKTWYNARQSCISQGGNLVTVKSSANNKDIYGLVGRSNYYWIGIKNVNTQGGVTMKYVDGSTLTYNNWKSDQPDNYQNKEHCVVMLRVSSEWSDLDCTSKHEFICQKKQHYM